MGLRFKKSIKIAPGIKFNIGKKSLGLSVRRRERWRVCLIVNAD